jgi:hypothetical protein
MDSAITELEKESPDYPKIGTLLREAASQGHSGALQVGVF